ncbi:glycogen debranching N-terminal domain-containing protein [Faunimonas sp. B44]|uniref:glycogen debranching N-terminal domain-containing protein n=1 Tax=Faunimonas sp. B44 TaxID=3461493 RepID=UPI004044A260
MAADFRDLFEVRGTKRKQRGEESARVLPPNQVELTYCGLDGLERRAALLVEPTPEGGSCGSAAEPAAPRNPRLESPPVRMVDQARRRLSCPQVDPLLRSRCEGTDRAPTEGVGFCYDLV